MEIKLFPLPKSKQFNMVTRFYEPPKGDMQEREERIKSEPIGTDGGKTISSYGSNIKGQFRNSRRRGNSMTFAEVRKKSNMRLIYILIILGALIYFFLK